MRKDTVSSKSKGEAAAWGWWTARPGWCIWVDRSSLETRGSWLVAHPASGAVAAEMHEPPVVCAALRGGGGQSGQLHETVCATQGRWLGHCVASKHLACWQICTMASRRHAVGNAAASAGRASTGPAITAAAACCKHQSLQTDRPSAVQESQDLLGPLGWVLIGHHMPGIRHHDQPGARCASVAQCLSGVWNEAVLGATEGRKGREEERCVSSRRGRAWQQAGKQTLRGPGRILDCMHVAPRYSRYLPCGLTPAIADVLCTRGRSPHPHQRVLRASQARQRALAPEVSTDRSGLLGLCFRADKRCQGACGCAEQAEREGRRGMGGWAVAR